MAAEHDMFVRLDMEDHRVTTSTIDVVLALHKEGLTNVGTVLQGRLFRTLADIEGLETELGGLADYRICKGIYLEPEDISFTGYRDIVDATNAAIWVGLSIPTPWATPTAVAVPLPYRPVAVSANARSWPCLWAWRLRWAARPGGAGTPTGEATLSST